MWLLTRLPVVLSIGVLLVLDLVHLLLLLQLLLLPLGELPLETGVLLGRLWHGALLVDPSQKEPSLAVVLVPVELDQERLLLRVESPLSALVDLVERVLRHFEHLHVRTELLDEGLDDVFRGGGGGDADAFRSNFLTGVVFVLRLGKKKRKK